MQNQIQLLRCSNTWDCACTNIVAVSMGSSQTIFHKGNSSISKSDGPKWMNETPSRSSCVSRILCKVLCCLVTQITKFMRPTWSPPGSCRPQMGPMFAPWTLLSGYVWLYVISVKICVIRLLIFLRVVSLVLEQWTNNSWKGFLSEIPLDAVTDGPSVALRNLVQ